MKYLTLFIFLVGAFTQNVSAQDEYNIQGYVLFNNYPYFVSMNQDGDIKEFLRTAPEIMKSASFDYALAPPVPLGPYNKPNAEIQDYISPLNTIVVSDGSGNVIEDNPEEEVRMVMQTKAAEGQDDSQSDRANDKTAFKTTVIRTEKPEETAPEVIIKKQENVDARSGEFVYEMKFPGFNARLTPELINKLEDISKIHKNNPTKKVDIYSYITTGDPTNKALAENRMNACKDLLVTYGVDESLVNTEIKPYRSSQESQVTISLVD